MRQWRDMSGNGEICEVMESNGEICQAMERYDI